MLGLRDIPQALERLPGEDDLPFLRRQMALGPLVKDRHGIVLAFSQAHLLECLTSPATRQVETDVLRLQGVTAGPAFAMASNSMLFANDPAHRRRRAPVSRAFAWKLMSDLRPAIRSAAEAVIAPHVGRQVDVLSAIAGPFPARVIGEILGLDPEDLPRFTALVYSAIRCISVSRAEEFAEASADMGRLWAAIAALLEDRRQAPRDDFLSAYLARVDAEGDLTAEEVVAQIVTVVIAGSDTTRIGLTATLGCLLQRPEAWAALVADPEGAKAGTVEEGLRYEPVIGSLARVVSQPFEIAGHRLSEGTLLGPLVITACRDAEVYAAPDLFDVARSDHPKLHPTFGFGPHRCLGEALARIELEEALAAIASRAPDTRLLAAAPRPRGLGAVRAIGPLQVAF